jgi:hypothetical protein
MGNFQKYWSQNVGRDFIVYLIFFTGHSNKTQHILFYEKRKMRIAVYNLKCNS